MGPHHHNSVRAIINWRGRGLMAAFVDTDPGK
jgi:hypothetical protein